MKTPEQELRDSLLELDPKRSWCVTRNEWKMSHLPRDGFNLAVTMQPGGNGLACQGFYCDWDEEGHSGLLTQVTLALRPYVAPPFMFLP